MAEAPETIKCGRCQREFADISQMDCTQCLWERYEALLDRVSDLEGRAFPELVVVEQPPAENDPSPQLLTGTDEKS